ncbi:MAG TPA: ABC transporter permease [Symbiobacteriaceae bacterium]
MGPDRSGPEWGVCPAHHRGEFPAALKARYLASKLSQLQDSGLVLAPLETVVRLARLQERGLSPEVAVEIMKPLEIEAVQITAGENQRTAEQFAGTLFLAIGAIMSVYVITVMNSQFVFQGVLEEKVSRVVEVMAGAVRPWEMMAGKILGLGGLGLTQYVLMIAAWLAGNVLSRRIVEVPTQSVSLRIAALIIVFTLLSYVLNATLMAALGATVSRMEDGQTVIAPVMMLMVVPMFMLTPVMSDPNGTAAVVLSFIPFFTPIIMLLRVIVGDVPAWQVGLSIGLLVVTTALATWMSGRVYRAALLTFGTRPTIKQLWQYLRTG